MQLCQSLTTVKQPTDAPDLSSSEPKMSRRLDIDHPLLVDLSIKVSEKVDNCQALLMQHRAFAAEAMISTSPLQETLLRRWCCFVTYSAQKNTSCIPRNCLQCD